MSLRCCRLAAAGCVLLSGLVLMLRCPSATAQGASRNLAQGSLEVTSGLGRALYALPDDASTTAARQAAKDDPRNVETLLKLSKAQAARRQYREAVATSTQALKLAPGNADVYLERGHRELGLREFRAAMKDLEKATQLAPDMLDAWYHLGLSHYFVGEFAAAAEAFSHARSLAPRAAVPDDSLIDCSNWLYVSLQRAGKKVEAAEVLTRITPAVKNTEPHLYFYLQLLHFYQGSASEQAVLPPAPKGPSDLEGELSFNTVSYGVGNWHVYHGDRAGALGLFRNVVKGEAWNSWGFIGSEIELERAVSHFNAENR